MEKEGTAEEEEGTDEEEGVEEKKGEKRKKVRERLILGSGRRRWVLYGKRGLGFEVFFRSERKEKYVYRSFLSDAVGISFIGFFLGVVTITPLLFGFLSH